MSEQPYIKKGEGVVVNIARDVRIRISRNEANEVLMDIYVADTSTDPPTWYSFERDGHKGIGFSIDQLRKGMR
jgi:hypothetical protein